MRMRWGALLLSASACGFGGAQGMALVEEDAGADATPDGSVQQPECKAGFLDLCGQVATAGSFVVASTEINTDTDERCRVIAQPEGPDVCLFYFETVEVQAGATLLAYGARPFALAAKGALKINGTLDVSSRRNRLAKRGAGGALAPAAGVCAFVSNPVKARGGGGGGAGGTFAMQGGGGGTGNQDNIGGGPGNAAGGTPGPMIALPAILRGGCNGQDGAEGQNAPGGPAGLGGGAVYLTAPSLTIAGTVLAGGSGGGGGDRDDGGGGGGSGGLVVAQSASLRVTGTLLATGGGGGRGGNGTQNGEAGDDATTPSAAEGGGGGAGGGGGGDGATLATGMRGGNDGAGAGGGGGGTGFILLLGNVETAGATIVPGAVTRAE